LAEGAKVIGPFSPKDFSDLTALNTAIATDVAAAIGSNAIVGAEPITVLGNIYIVVSFT
tara:strand:+ start:21253 stop:21429 length:177 start_codon:yes stop_codon:yes gene_type:complete